MRCYDFLKDTKLNYFGWTPPVASAMTLEFADPVEVAVVLAETRQQARDGRVQICNLDIGECFRSGVREDGVIETSAAVHVGMTEHCDYVNLCRCGGSNTSILCFLWMFQVRDSSLLGSGSCIGRSRLCFCAFVVLIVADRRVCELSGDCSLH